MYFFKNTIAGKYVYTYGIAKMYAYFYEIYVHITLTAIYMKLIFLADP